MGDAIFQGTVWAQRELCPRTAVPLPNGELPLDRDFLGNVDGTLSRAPNAPRLVVTDRTVRLVDNPRSARRALVVPGTRLMALQGRGDALLELASGVWPVRAGSLGLPGRLVASPRGSVALLSVFTPRTPAASFRLRTLPPATWLAPGEEIVLDPPVLVVLGDSVLEILSDETGVPPPDPIDGIVDRDVALDLSVLARLELPEQLDNFGGHPSEGVIQIPGAGDGEPLALAELRAAALLRECGRSFLFVPVIADHRLLASRSPHSPRAQTNAAKPACASSSAAPNPKPGSSRSRPTSIARRRA